MKKIQIRKTEEKDFQETVAITREIFWNLYKPGCDEHLVLHNLRKSSAYVPRLDRVACEGEKIVGNIVYSRAKVVDSANRESLVLCMGPVGVLPSHQGKGIGTVLIMETLATAENMGFCGVILFGKPTYYSRFGFVNAKKYGITTPDGQNLAPFMALELAKGSLKHVSGRFFADPLFEVDEKELEVFDKQFPKKDKEVLDTQLHNS